MLKKLLFIPILLLSFYENFGQGIHYTYLDFAPQHVNPANIGGFLGSYRGAGIYRDQFNNTGVRGYKTFEIAIDLPVLRGFRKQDWIGAGVSINRDMRGTVRLTDMYSRLGLSYHLGLNPKQTSVFTVGLQMININRTLNSDYDNGVTPEGISTGVDRDLKTLFNSAQNGKLTTSGRDWNIGIQYTSNQAKSSFKVGASTSGLLGTDSLAPFRFIGYTQMISMIGKTTTIEPTLLIQLTEVGGAEVMANAKIGMQLKKESKDRIKAGIGFRTGTFSAVFLAGAEIKGINFGLSYDLPISGYAEAPGIQNGFEFGVSYIGLFKKTPKLKPIVVCPRL